MGKSDPLVGLREAQQLECADQPALSVGTAFDVALRRLQRSMAYKLLDITERATSFMYKPGGQGHKGPPAGVGRASLQTQLPELQLEPVDDNLG